MNDIFSHNGNIETLSGDKTLKSSDNIVQVLDCNGSDRRLNLPPVGGDDLFAIKNNTANTYALNVYDADGDLITSIRAGGTEIIISDGSNWHAVSGKSNYWVDVDFPIIVRNTGAGIPSLTTLNGRITAPQWAVGDFNQCESQEFIHPWQEGSTSYWHIHLTTNGMDATDRFVRFEIEFGYVTPNGQWEFQSVMDSGDLLIPANTPTKTMKILSLGSFTPANVKIGGHCIAYLKRIASSGAAPSNDPWVPMLQMHILCDALGSRQITTK
jgi:hypothetical protein